MVHLRIQVPGRDGAPVTREIAAKGLLHLIDIAHGTSSAAGPGAVSAALLARFRDLTNTLSRVREILGLPPVDVAGSLPGAAAGDLEIEYEQLSRQLEPLRSEVEALGRRRSHAREERARLASALDRAERLEAARVDAGRLARLRFSIVRVGSAAPEELRRIAGMLTPAPFAIIPLDERKPQPLAAVAVPLSSRDRLESALRAAPFEAVDVAGDDGALAPGDLRRRLDAAAGEEASAARELAEAAARHGGALAGMARRAEIALLLLQAQSLFATAGRFLVISGWIPQDRADELVAAIARVSEHRAIVTKEQPDALSAAYGPSLSVPILHRNPLLLRPFDRLVQVYGVPSYGEVQPTAFFAISFLLMFGAMFGDVGHGLVLLSAGYCLFRYMPRFLDYAILLMEAGAASAFFGVIYGSVFGVETLLPGVAHPMRDIGRLAAAAIGIGIVLVSGGVLLNIVNSWRAGERVAALTSTRGLFGAFMYWAALAIAARAVLPAGWKVPDAAVFLLAGAGIALIASRPLVVRWLRVDRARAAEGAAPRPLAALESSIELVDALFSYFANTISFVRVAAFAAVHGGVFLAIFALADTFSRFRFGGVLSLAVLVAGNIVMILLEGLTVTVQVLRLEYYEFFSRFFRGGGEPYRPLMLRPNGAQGG
jgi:V/A-type H+-transporting ATPase subunit I